MLNLHQGRNEYVDIKNGFMFDQIRLVWSENTLAPAFYISNFQMLYIIFHLK